MPELPRRGVSGMVAWAGAYRRRGYTLLRIRPNLDPKKRGNTKKPTDTGWPDLCPEPQSFARCNVGIVCGQKSGGLLCVDVDYRDEGLLALEVLPRTGMVDGRPGSPASHFWYRVPDLGSFTARKIAKCNLGHIELRGNRHFVIVPPSVWYNKDESFCATREWFGGSFGEPSVCGFDLLVERSQALARRLGWTGDFLTGPQVRSGPVKTPKAKLQQQQMVEAEEAPNLFPVRPDEVKLRWASHWLRRAPRSVAGSGGDETCFAVVCHLVEAFDCTPGEVLWLFENVYNKKTRASLGSDELFPWRPDEILHKINCVDGRGKTDMSYARPPMALAGLGSAPVWIGQGLSRIEEGLLPNWVELGMEEACRPALVRGKRPHILHKFFFETDLRGLPVVLAPASNVRTNKGARLCVQSLAHWLRDSFGVSDVEYALVDSPTGRITTTADLDMTLTMTRELPPLEKNPRKYGRAKKSRALDRAKAWLIKNKVPACTADVVGEAKEDGIAERTLKRAFTVLIQERRS